MKRKLRTEWMLLNDWEEVMDDDDDPMVTVCAGPPLCLLEGDEAVAAANNGCELCKHIICYPDGTETIIERSIN
jgi:hypothetical protein